MQAVLTGVQSEGAALVESLLEKCHVEYPEDMSDEHTVDCVRQVLLARLRLVEDSVNQALSGTAEEWGVHNWPPVDVEELSAWCKTLSTVPLETVDEKLLKEIAMVDSEAKSIAVMLLAAAKDQERRGRVRHIP